MIGDSQCTISALESVTAILGPYFANRILELESTINGWGVLNTDSEMIETPLKTILANNDTIMVDPIYHTAGELNIADMATRGKVEIKDVGYGSVWQSGPSYLREKASVINDRPLGIRVHNKTEGDLVPVTPNLLLMAKTATSAKDNNLSDEGPSRLVKKQKRMEEVVGAWWNEWYSQVFSSLVPYNKWKKEKPNLEVGDVCLVKYDHKVGKADYRICRVEEVEMDAKGLVRTVTVGMRPRDSREKSLPYKSKKLKSLKLAIQRLILICLAKEVK